MFKRFAIILFISFATILLFVFLVRLANNKSGFVGLSDLFDYFESVDFYKPLENLINDFQSLQKAWNLTATQATNSFDRFFEIFTDAFNAGLKTVSFPFVVFYDLLSMIVGYFQIIISFFSWIVSFNGYTPVTI